jgi:hypothetical protein
MELFDEAGLTMCKSNVNQNELMTTLLKKIESLAQDHSNFKRITERNFNKVVEFTETSDRNRAKETRDLAKTMGMNHDTETDQPQISTHLETDADNITDDETDGPNTSQRQRINHVTTRRGNYGGEEQRLPAGEAIHAIETLQGQEDVGVEDFILSVRKARARCKVRARDFLLDLILIEKITDNAKKSIRHLKINSFEDLYSCLRQNMSAPTTVSDCKDKLRNLEQGMTETVQSFNSRFRQQLNELNYAIQNEDRTPIEQRVAIDMEEREALKTYLLSLRPEISQMVIASDPKTLNLAQQVAANKER